MSKNGRTTTLDQPIQHLYPLEVLSHTDTVSDQEDSELTECEKLPEQSAPRPKRSTATQARDHILAQAMAEWDN